MCHHAGVGHIETEVVTHAKEFLTSLFFSEVYKSRINHILSVSLLRLVAKYNMAQVW